MKNTIRRIQSHRAIALLVLAVSCTMTQREARRKEKLLIAAGFKVIVPSTAAQQQTLKAD